MIRPFLNRMLSACLYLGLAFCMSGLYSPRTLADPLFRSLSQGTDYHTCVVTTAGAVQCWGENFYGELGNTSVASGSGKFSAVPVTVTGLPAGLTATTVVVGSGSSCALMSDGSVWCWGNNTFGQLGDPWVTSSSPQPVQVLLLPATATAISMGVTGTACAALSNAQTWCWGNNNQQALGQQAPNSSESSSPQAQQVAGVVSLNAVAVGFDSACTLINEYRWVWVGQIKKAVLQTVPECWGDNSDGEAGQPGNTYPSWIAPTIDQNTVGDITSIAQGDLFTCALSTSEGVLCWGDDTYGELGDSGHCAIMPMSNCNTPQVAVFASQQPRKVSTGGVSACAIPASTGGVVCWGDNAWGQLGNNSTTQASAPVVAQISSSARDVAAAGDHSCAIINNGYNIQCWGHNNYGQLGNGLQTDSHVPVNVH